MPKTLIIFNPMSNHGRSGQVASDLRALIDQFGGATWMGTEHPAHATKIAAQAAAQGYELVIVLGGDGTVHETINGLMQIPAERRPRLGLIPLGSGNDFAGGLKVPFHPEDAVRRAFEGQPKPVDVIHITDGAGHSEYFNNSCGIGFDAAVNLRTRELTFVHGFFMYLTGVLLTIAFNFQAPRMKITYDGGVIDQPTMMLTLGNGPRQGGGFQTTPNAKPDDGVVDFLYIHQISQLRMLYMLIRVLQVAHIHEPDVAIKTTRKMVVDADRALPIHVDGEVFATYEANVRHVEIEVIPGAVQVML